jgi:YggT family protein
MTFLRDVADPWLRIFRKFIPSFGGIDLSPIVALVVLEIIDRIVLHLIRG